MLTAWRYLLLYQSRHPESYQTHPRVGRGGPWPRLTLGPADVGGGGTLRPLSFRVTSPTLGPWSCSLSGSSLRRAERLFLCQPPASGACSQPQAGRTATLTPGCFLNLGLTPACTRTAPGPCPLSSLGLQPRDPQHPAQSTGAPRGLAGALVDPQGRAWTHRGLLAAPLGPPQTHSVSAPGCPRPSSCPRPPHCLHSGRAQLPWPFRPSSSRHLPGSLSASSRSYEGEAAGRS